MIVRIWAGQAPDHLVEEHTAAFAESYATDHIGQLPGLKSPPPVEGDEALAVGVAVGAIAPDMLLPPVSPAPDADDLWRLSDHRGGMVTIAIVPPGCMRCGRAVGAKDDATQGAIILLSDEQGTERLELVWSSDVGRLFSPNGDLQLIEVDARGVITSVSGMLE